ncbi:MAG: metallophosphoesterase [Candidatus Aureabacteria bacterium]|nr:metallophosphoesterase [Candidatus Auribacterota bacterium]
MRINKTLLSGIVLIPFLFGGPVSAATKGKTSAFSFAVVADCRWWEGTWRNALAEIKNSTVDPEPKFGPAELIVVVGDMDPAEKRYANFKEVFAAARRVPLFLPVIGNHDDGDDARYIRDVIIPAIPGCVRRDGGACDYFLDYKNVRIVVIDAYTELGKEGVINQKGRDYAEQAIRSAGPGINHIFVCFHEPAFPRARHLDSSFNESPGDRDAFWNMLVRHRDSVRAVFVSHDHYYNRMRVKDPSSRAANDPAQFPDEEGGIYQVDCGAVGMTTVSTVVRVKIEGKSVSFRVVQADRGGNEPFRVREEWDLGGSRHVLPSSVAAPARK